MPRFNVTDKFSLPYERWALILIRRWRCVNHLLVYCVTSSIINFATLSARERRLYISRVEATGHMRVLLLHGS